MSAVAQPHGRGALRRKGVARSFVLQLPYREYELQSMNIQETCAVGYGRPLAGEQFAELVGAEDADYSVLFGGDDQSRGS